MTEKRNWPTREEWARNRTTLYADQAPGLDHTLKAHASEAEIREAISALENLWRDLGRQMRNRRPNSRGLISWRIRTTVSVSLGAKQSIGC
jgi:hypothetical protein